VERRKKKDSSLYGDCKLFLSENRLEVVRVDYGIASTLPFWIDVPSSSESIWFGAETTRAEPDNKVELGEVLGPLRQNHRKETLFFYFSFSFLFSF